MILAIFVATAFIFGTCGASSGAEGKKGSGAGQAVVKSQNDSIFSNAYQLKERHEFEVKNRTRNEGDEFQVRVEERLEQEITESTENEELAEGNEDKELTEAAENEESTGQGPKGLEKRIAKLEEKLAEKPGDPKLLWNLAVAYRNAGEYDKAIGVLKELEGQLTHPTAKVAVLLAQCLRAKGDSEAALAELEKLLESPTTVPGAVYAYKAILKEELGKVEEAAEDMEEAIAAEPEDKDLYKKVGELYSKAGKKGVKVFVKGKKLALDAEPFVENGRTMVPVRAIAEALGLEVGYKDDVITITNPVNGRKVVLRVGNSEAEVDGQKVILDAPAQVVPPGRTVVPLRFVSENLGANVNWFEDGQVVAVNEE